jgi:3-hydroxyisobutyrate dehydrogenase-like beta-hydroxyacid dehydrogenase
VANLGIIGLGLVGSAISERLLAAGHHVFGFDLDSHRMDELVQCGGKAVADAADVAQYVDACFLSLPTSAEVETVLGNLIPHMSGKTIIDTTTGEPEFSQSIGELLEQRNISYLDATIAGSSKQVRTGDVLVLVGGQVIAYYASQPWLACFARHCYFLGSWGSGSRMKLVVNLVLGLNRAVLAEGLSFARGSGIDPGRALEILQDSVAYSRVMDYKGRKMIERDFSVEARLAQHHKDVRLILTSAERAGLELPLSRLHDRLLSLAESRGMADADNSAIITIYDESP